MPPTPLQKIAVLGSNGQVGRAWVSLLGDRAVAIDRSRADFTRPESTAHVLDEVRPDAVVIAAAYTAVDPAETDTENARLVNAASPGVIAKWCAAHSVPLVHYSTDYVYPGTGTAAWKESDETSPLNVYGQTKLEGEKAVENAGGKFLIFRTSWVFDSTGKNFVRTMLRLGAEREVLKVVADQVGAPTYAPHLVQASWDALQKAIELPSFPSGVYNLSGAGETSWHGFAQAIFETARAAGAPLKVKQVEKIGSKDFSTLAKRPLNSRLSTEKFCAVFEFKMLHWQLGLRDCIELMEKQNAFS